MTRWKNDGKPIPNTHIIPSSFELKHMAGFSGGGIVTENGDGDSVTSTSEVPSSTVPSILEEHGGAGLTNGVYHYEEKGNGDDYSFVDENEPSTSTGPAPFRDNKNRRGRGGRKGSNDGRTAASALTPAQQPTASDFLKDRPRNKSPIALGPPPSPVRGGNSSYLRNGQDTFGAASNWNPNGGTIVSNGSYRPPGDVGLTNLGNTCFMNSGLQCLIHTASLAEHFLKGTTIKARIGGESLMFEFQLVMQQAWFGTSASLNVTDFRNKLGEIHSQFKDGRQHDCQEFLALTLDTLHEQMKKISIKKEVKEKCESPSESNIPSDENCVSTNGTEEEVPAKKRRQSTCSPAEVADNYYNKHMAENNTVIAKTFQGVFKSTVVCKECQYVSVTYEPFMYLSLPIPRIVSKTFNVTFISLKDTKTPIRVTVTVNLEDQVQKLKEFVAKEIPGFGSDSSALGNCFVFEVVNHNVARRILFKNMRKLMKQPLPRYMRFYYLFWVLFHQEDEYQIKFLQEDSRNIYMYEMNDNFAEKYGVSTNLSFLSGTCTHMFYPPPKTMGSEMQPSTYLDEDWEQDDAPSSLPPLIEISEGLGTVDTTSPITTDFIGPLPSSSTSEATATQSEVPYSGNEVCNSNGVSSSAEGDEGRGEHDSRGNYIQCIICLDDKPTVELRKHKICGAALCLECLARATSYFETNENTCGAANGSHLKCPTCCVPVAKEQFVTFWTDPNPQLILTAVLFRRNFDTNNNSVSSPPRYFGAPLVVRIPTTVPAEELHSFLAQTNPFPELECKIVTVSNDGSRCGRCSIGENCDGCELGSEGEISLPINTCVAFSYINITEEQISSVEPPDMAITATPFVAVQRNDPPIDIHDCLRTFSEVEQLDEPFHCPECKKNQKATKTMTISRFPDFLIIYLKRFVFADHSSIKLSNRLTFPLEDLDIGPYIAPEVAGKYQHLYDLYSVVCHFGCAQAGHYTAYGRNPVTETWRYFNDSAVDDKVPENEFATAYVLFYQRKGLNYDIPKRTADNMIHRPIPALHSLPMASSSNSNRPVGTATPMVAKPPLTGIWNNTNGHGSGTQPDSSSTVEEDKVNELSLNSRRSLESYPHSTSTIRLGHEQMNGMPGGFMQQDTIVEDDGDGFGTDFDENTPKKRTETLTVYNEAMDQSRSMEVDEA